MIMSVCQMRKRQRLQGRSCREVTLSYHDIVLDGRDASIGLHTYTYICALL
jgi:hypothetical protein